MHPLQDLTMCNRHVNYELSSDFIYRTNPPALHRDEEYSQEGFKILYEMQSDHFWYRGRHKFLLAAFKKYFPESNIPASLIDLGGGVGGWLNYLAQHHSKIEHLALADSSSVALSLAQKTLDSSVNLYQVDLMDLQMKEEWDAAFLLDVIEHIPNDLCVLEQVRDALKPGGVLFITAPAFRSFWSYQDDLAKHLRRYQRDDFEELAKAAGLTLLDSRYFMFFLSPLYLLSRLGFSAEKLTQEQKNHLTQRQHRVPPSFLNRVFYGVFKAESKIGHRIHFPWGTSILGVFKKT